MISIYEEKCQGCGLCVVTCPKKNLTINKSKVNIRGYSPAALSGANNCNDCALCAVMCPDCVIEVRR